MPPEGGFIFNMGDCETPEHVRVLPMARKLLRFSKNISVFEVPSDPDSRDARIGTWQQDAEREEREDRAHAHQQQGGCGCTETVGECKPARAAKKASAAKVKIIRADAATVRVTAVECVTGCGCAVCCNTSSWIDWVLQAQERARGVPCSGCAQE